MTLDPNRAQAVFLLAAEQATPEGRAAVLDRECRADADLRRRVEALLRAHDDPGSALDRPLVPPWAAPAAPGPLDTEGPGARVGPYTLGPAIGQGGMGVVYEATQEEPVRRTVALKVIRPGMDTAQVVARFDAERQALALMDHPNIARVLDAGTTPTGRPFFVMERVEGPSVTAYCDARRLTPRQRLELMLPVCQAVQHAHQKGIIHRDLKPSNVLVAEVDGRPVPKVIDFGVAKAVGPHPSAGAGLTHHGALVGTPESMSPEQAGASPDVDTRTDVYGLGVLLYELLTGTTPLDRETLRRATFDEVLRRVREEEPPTPSTRLSGAGDRLPSVAAERSTEPARLARLVRGDLDRVVMKALEKDRSRRYETAAALARDLQRYLDGDPVEAAPPSRAYRLRKFARKHRVALATAAAFVLVLGAAAALSGWAAWRATQAAARERQTGVVAQARLRQVERATDLLLAIFLDLDPAVDEQGGEPLRVVLGERIARAADRIEGEKLGDPLAVARLQQTLGVSLAALGMFDRSVDLLTRAVRTREARLGPRHPDTVAVRNDLADAYLLAGRVRESIVLFEAILEERKADPGPDHHDTALSRNNLANAYLNSGRAADAVAQYEAALKVLSVSPGVDDLIVLKARDNLAAAYVETGRVEDAVTQHREVVKALESRLRPNHPDTLTARGHLSNALYGAGRTAEALALDESILAARVAELGSDHPDTIVSRQNLAASLWRLGRLDRSVPLFEEALRQQRQARGVDHYETLNTQANLGVNYRDAGRPAEGARLMEDALRRAGERPEALAALDFVPEALAAALEAAGRYDAAEPYRRRADDAARASQAPKDPRAGASVAALGFNLLRQQKWSQAEPVLREGLALREATQPGVWSTFNTRSLLGGALLGQGRYAEAEPLIVSGYEGMMSRAATIPPPARPRLVEAAERGARLYEAWGKPDRAEAWKARVGLRDLPADVFASAAATSDSP